ncbi:MAG: hypothetical protein IT173_06015 [Acidobacteria bacterium]|nr:hypothetical protein [Acidobacteriota bacterium]
MSFKHLILLTIVALMQQGCYIDFEDRGPRYDIRQISVGQTSVYFKMEIRGRNYEGLSISGDGNLCKGPSPRTDFFLDSLDVDGVYYKVEGEKLYVYSYTAFTPPQAGSFPVTIVQNVYSPPAQFDEEKIKKLGYTELVFTNEALKYCSE